MEQKEIINQRRKYLEDLKKEKKDVVPNHKYVKNFNHLIAIVSNALDGDEFKNYINERGTGIDDVSMDAKFYYENVYKQPYCDQYTWLINNGRPDLLISYFLEMEIRDYFKTNRFCGKSYGKIMIDIPEELKGK